MTPPDPFAVAGRLIERRKNGIRHIDEEEQEIEILAAEVVRLSALVEALTAIEGKTDRITDPVLIEAFTGQTVPTTIGKAKE